MNDTPNVALCLFGQMRTYERTYNSINKNIISLLNPDVFIHTWEEIGGTWKGSIENPSSQVIKPDTIEQLYSPKKYEIEKFEEEYYHSINGVEVPKKVRDMPNYGKGLLPMFYKIHKVTQLKREYERSEGFQYDIVILMRPDLLIFNKIPDKVLTRPSILWTTDRNLRNLIDDRLLISSSSNIDYIASIWEKLPQMWDNELGDEYGPMGFPKGGMDVEIKWQHIGVPERLLYYHIEQSSIKHKIDNDVNYKLLRHDDRIHPNYKPDAGTFYTVSYYVNRSKTILANGGIREFISSAWKKFISSAWKTIRNR
jgi:hypothetical protein